jgi:hypothetical protein
MLTEMWASWRTLLTQPRLAVYQEEARRTSMEKALVSALIAGIVMGLAWAATNMLQWGVMAALGSIYSPKEPLNTGLTPLFIVIFPIVSPIVSILGLLISSAILLISARVFGGAGDFVTQTYMLSMAYTPITIISAVLGIIPCLGGMASIGLFIYWLVLLTLVVRAVHSVSVERAVVIWAAPGVLLLAIFGGCIAAVFFAALSAGGFGGWPEGTPI